MVNRPGFQVAIVTGLFFKIKIMNNQNLIEFLKQQGYSNVIEIPGKGVCGLMRMVFTTGLFYNMNYESYEGRYCFELSGEAKDALNNWDGNGDPAGNWIKHKGKIEYSNPQKAL